MALGKVSKIGHCSSGKEFAFDCKSRGSYVDNKEANAFRIIML